MGSKKKKKLPAKKVSKKSIAKKRTQGKPPQTMAMVTVPIEQIQKVETYKGKMSVIPTPLTELQIRHLVAPTPDYAVLNRPGKGGKNFDYIPVWYFRKKLNFTFGWMHDFEILGERVDGDFITVKGKLTIKDKAGKEMISKTDFGGHPVTYKKDMAHKPENYLDISNDFKAAASDCLKRCAVQLGIGLDVYSKGDYTNPDQPEAPVSGPVKVQQASPAQHPTQAKVVEAKAVVSSSVDYVDKLNKKLEEHGYKTNTQKAEFVFMRTSIRLSAKKWAELSQKDAQVIIGALARINAAKRK